MIFEQLKPLSCEFTHLIHAADIHVRLTKRHAEYREVFERFYKNIETSPDSTVVVLAGDIFHSKSELSPECVQMVSDFLYSCAERRNTVLIPGNHDATLSNKTRLDSLSPIVDALGHNNLYYLKECKLYGFGNILFNNMCVFSKIENYILGKDIPEIYRNQYKHIVALYHGTVDRAVTDSGFMITNPSMIPEIFDWHDLALLGDVHRRQNIQEEVLEKHKPCIHYPGSMIQQDHGECLNPHGYTIWELSTNDYQYKEIPNDYGFFTILIKGAKIISDITNLPKKTYLRIKCYDSIASEVKAVEAAISSKTEIVEVMHIREESEDDKKAKDAAVCQNVKLAEITNIDYQNTLLTEFLKKKLNITDQSVIDQILLINREINTEIKKDDFARNLKWVPIKFEWDNMFRYGEENVIDFTHMNGVYGIFGPNTCGKSSIFSAICFCLFDKWERGFKAIVARNVSKEGFRCKFEFEISGVRYFIEKIGESTRSGNVKVDVRFWRVVNGVEQDLTDIQRRKTNDIIRDYVGTFDDFILTTFSVQSSTKNNVSFIDMGNTERKDLLVQIIGLNLFDRLYEVGYAKGKELATLIKVHNGKNYPIELTDAEETLELTESQIKDAHTAIDDIAKQIKGVNDSIVTETSKLIKLDNDVPTDIAALNSRKKSIVDSLELKNNQLQKDKAELIVKKNSLITLEEIISETNVEDLILAHQNFNSFAKQLAEKQRHHELKQVSMRNKHEKLQKLKIHKYDPNCKFCVENIFVKDARQTEKELINDQSEMDAFTTDITRLQEEVKRWDWGDEAYKTYTKNLNLHSQAKDIYNELNTNILLSEKDIEKLNQTLKETQSKIDIYHRNQVSVENNQKININILNFKNTLSRLESSFHTKNNQLLELTGKREVIKKQIQTISATMMQMLETETTRQLYEYYCNAVGRNGIPYQVICNTIPQLEREINSILTQTADFTIEIEADEKNITPYVNYPNRGRWPIEMTSGFERFVSSVAIRVALNNITNLPRTNFLLLDEGFGSLDGHNLPSMYTLFTYLKSFYEFIIVVSHLDSLKDMVEKQIEITQVGNFSKVTFE